MYLNLLPTHESLIFIFNIFNFEVSYDDLGVSVFCICRDALLE